MHSVSSEDWASKSMSCRNLISKHNELLLRRTRAQLCNKLYIFRTGCESTSTTMEAILTNMVINAVIFSPPQKKQVKKKRRFGKTVKCLMKAKVRKLFQNQD